MFTELRLTFQQAAEGWTVGLNPNWGAEPSKPVPFTSPLDEKDHEDLRWYLEDYMDMPAGGNVTRAQRIEDKLEGWGHDLYRQLFDKGDCRELLNHLLRAEGPRILSVASNDPDLLRVPWELLRDRRGPFTSLGVTIRRQFAGAGGVADYRFGLPLRILLAVARPDDIGFLDPRSTARGMLDALEDLGGDVQVYFCRPPTLAQMRQMIDQAVERGEPYHILHFDGHGDYIPALGVGVLCFEKEAEAEDRPTDYVRADRLGDLLAAKNVPLAVLDACRGSAIAKAPLFRSVAPRLLEAGVGSVIAMSHSVHVEATRILFGEFYRELARGKMVGQALEAGRAGLLARPARWLARGPDAPSVDLSDWFLPTLYQRGGDPVMVDVGKRRKGKAQAPAARPPAGRGEVGAFPDPPLYRFHGRAQELYRLERAFEWQRAVVLHGMGGMGKTALAREAAFWWHRTGLFPDGACFMSFERGAGAEEAVRVLGCYLLGEEFQRLPAAEQWAEAKRLFQEKRVLMVWDNFESVLPQFSDFGRSGDLPHMLLYDDEVRGRIQELFRDWTVDERGQGRLLITARPEETHLPGVRRFPLGGLLPPDGLSLALRVCEQHGIEWRVLEREKVAELLVLMGNHPLSIELVTPHLKRMVIDDVLTGYAELLRQEQARAEAEAKVAGREVERNESLLASLAFSTRRLSAEAQAALPWLAWFSGGVFEVVLLAFSQIDPAAWEAIRGELEGTALVSCEYEWQMGDRPYLRFHPTLPYAARPEEVPGDPAEVKGRFVAVYGAVMGAVDDALRGPSPRAGMEVIAREEGNFRLAIARALELGWTGAATLGETLGEYLERVGRREFDRLAIACALELGWTDAAATLGETLGEYLERAGRRRERDRLAAWLAGQVRRGPWTAQAAMAEMREAEALRSQGRAGEAVAGLEELICRLEATTEFAPAFPLALARMYLGKIYTEAGQAARAVPILEQAVRQWEELAAPGGEAERGNLAACLSNLANALMGAGQLDEALAAAERGLAISEELGRGRDVADDHRRTAQILAMQGRYAEADGRYARALAAARAAGDLGLEGLILQHQGSLADARGDYRRAAALYKEVLVRFQATGDDGAVMHTCNSLGGVEQEAGRLAEARAWYEKARELARRRNDAEVLGATAHNLGIVTQQEGEQARAAGDEVAARGKFLEAVRFVQESLDSGIARSNQPGAAQSLGQLGWLYLLLGDLAQAEAHAHRAVEIYEEFGLPDLWKAYDVLEAIALARGEAAAEAAWREKKEAVRVELERRAGGGGPPAEFVRAVGMLIFAVGQAALAGAALPPGVAESLAALESYPPPFGQIPAFLRAAHAGQRPLSPIPKGLPPELHELLAALREECSKR
jgi:tetratricopeptide (TPR) repeat protein